MITLKTGVPGSGKTLTAVSEIIAAFQAAGASESVPRLVYTHGIPELSAPVVPLPVFNPVVLASAKKGEGFSRAIEVDWAEVAPGSLVFVDEAQQIFPPRSSGSVVPGYVAFLNVHRHRGIDVVLLTQHPSLIDSAVRKLVGKHQHFRRVGGFAVHVRYEWDSCSETLAGKSVANRRVLAFPKRAFAAYKSAELHTKQRFSFPVWSLVPLFAVIGLVLGVPKVYQVLTPGKQLPVVVAASAPANGAPVNAGSSAVVSVVAAASGPAGAPFAGDPVRFAGVVLRPTWPAYVGGCWLVRGGVCRCVTNEPHPRVVEPEGGVCAAVVAGLLGPDPSRPVPTPAVVPPPGAFGVVQPGSGSDPSPAGASGSAGAA